MYGKTAPIVAGLTLALGLSAGAASAATFDLFGFPLNQTVVNVGTIDDISLTISSTGGTLHFNGSGVGVNGANDVSNLLEEGEAITFTFDPTVTLLDSVVFEVGGGNERVTVLDENSDIMASFDVLNQSGNQNTFVDVDLTGLNLTGNVFTFTTEELGNGNPRGNPGIRIQSITAVPVPASLPLLAFGIGAFAFIARRNRKSKAA